MVGWDFEPKNSPKSRAWCFTANLPNAGLDCVPITKPVEDERVRYQCWQYEAAPTTGQVHIQGYLYLHNTGTFHQVLGLLIDWCGVHPHLEAAKGNSEQNKVYCSKLDDPDGKGCRIPGTKFYEFGDFPNQGKRSDLTDFYEAVESNGGRLNKVIVERYTSQAVMYSKRAKEVAEEVKNSEWIEQVEKRRKLRVVLYYGDPGVGKSHSAREYITRYLGDVPYFTASWNKPGEAFYNYKGQKVVILDDFYDQLSPAQLKTALDVYSTDARVIYKGNVPFIPEWIFITSNHAIEDWWGGHVKRIDLEAIIRRIHLIYECKLSLFGKLVKTKMGETKPWWMDETERDPITFDPEEVNLLEDKPPADPVAGEEGGIVYRIPEPEIPEFVDAHMEPLVLSTPSQIVSDTQVLGSQDCPIELDSSLEVEDSIVLDSLELE